MINEKELKELEVDLEKEYDEFLKVIQDEKENIKSVFNSQK